MQPPYRPMYPPRILHRYSPKRVKIQSSVERVHPICRSRKLWPVSLCARDRARECHLRDCQHPWRREWASRAAHFRLHFGYPLFLLFIVAAALSFGNKPQRGGQDTLHHVAISPGRLIRILFRTPTLVSASTLLEGVSPSQGVCQKYRVSVPIWTAISRYRWEGDEA